MKKFISFSRTIIGKLSLIFLVVICVVSCKNNKDSSQGEFGTISSASKNVISILGKSKAEAEKRILNAGFRVMKNQDFDYDFSGAPRRIPSLLKEQNIEEDENYSFDDATFYVYNISEEMENMEEEEIVNAIIDSKQSAIIFQAGYINGILANVNGEMIIGAEIDYVNELYLDCSKNLYSNITMLGTWKGTITDMEKDEDKQIEYSNYQIFSNALAPLNSVFASESAACALDLKGNGFGYIVTWDKPNEQKARFQINNSGYKTAIATASFSISYTSASMYQ